MENKQLKAEKVSLLVCVVCEHVCVLHVSQLSQVVISLLIERFWM